MKKIMLFIITCVFILSCKPDDVLSEGTPVSVKNRKAVKAEPSGPSDAAPAPAPVPASAPVSAPVEAATALIKAAAAPVIEYAPQGTGPEDEKGMPVYMSGPAYGEKFVPPPLYPEVQVPGALTLAECYRMALLQSEIIAINADLIKEADSHFLEALSILLPHISFVSLDYQETVPDDKGTSMGSLKPPRSSTRNFNVTQTLFNGFKAIAGIRGAKYEKTQRTDEKIRAEQLLLVDVANAFYLLKEKREDLKALAKTKKALTNRVKELIAREKLGRSRPSEVVNAKTQLYGVEATIEVVRSHEVLARQLLGFLVGQPVGKIVDTYTFPIKLMPEEYYISKATTRPDVEAAKFAWQLAKENIRVVESDFLPEVNFNGNYYTQRTAFDKGTDWDISLTIDVPIFDGTEVLGRSKTAHLQADEKMQDYHRTRRQAPYDIKDSFVSLVTAMTVHDTLRKAYSTAKLNYYLQKKDYERSLVNNLEVLTSIQTLEDAERSYIHALYEAKREYWQLRVAIGQSGTESLNDAF
ncbi:MAG: TolC family protein [Candidatus Omnitrophota bacterium]